MLKSRTIVPKTHPKLLRELEWAIHSQREILKRLRNALYLQQPIEVSINHWFDGEGYSDPMKVKVRQFSPCEDRVQLLFLNTYTYESNVHYYSFKKNSACWFSIHDILFDIADES